PIDRDLILRPDSSDVHAVDHRDACEDGAYRDDRFGARIHDRRRPDAAPSQAIEDVRPDRAPLSMREGEHAPRERKSRSGRAAVEHGPGPWLHPAHDGEWLRIDEGGPGRPTGYDRPPAERPAYCSRSARTP